MQELISVSVVVSLTAFLVPDVGAGGVLGGSCRRLSGDRWGFILAVETEPEACGAGGALLLRSAPRSATHGALQMLSDENV